MKTRLLMITDYSKKILLMKFVFWLKSLNILWSQIIVMPPKTNRKCSVDGCDKKHQAKGFCKSHYMKHLRKNPEWREQKNKQNMERYYKKHDEYKERKREIQGKYRKELYHKLGGKCVSCGEKFNSDLIKSNLQIHLRI